MAILVTGGLGHVGSWTAYKLAKQGNKVILFDSSVDTLEDLNLDFLNEVKENLVLENGNVLDFHAITRIMEKYHGKIEGIIHSAALIGVPDFIERPFQNVSLNTVGTLNMLEVTRIFRIKKFIYISSGAVYGDTKGILHEGLSYKAADLYGASKISGELFTQQYGDTFDMDVRIARVYFIYGPGKMPSKMYPLYKGLFGPLEGVFNYVAETGADTEIDFTHIWDVAQGVAKIYQKESMNHRIFNISCGIKVSLRKIVDMVKEIVKEDTGVLLGPGIGLKRGAPLDINRIRDEVGYEPMFSDIREGLENYYNWIVLQKLKRDNEFKR